MHLNFLRVKTSTETLEFCMMLNFPTRFNMCKSLILIWHSLEIELIYEYCLNLLIIFTSYRNKK